MLTSKMDRIVAEHYGGKCSLSLPETSQNIIVSTDSLPRVNGYGNSQYQRFFTIPLIFYTYSEEVIQCRINPKIYASIFVNQLNSLLSSRSEKLNDKILEISVNRVPSTLNHKYNSHFVFVPLLYSDFSFGVSNNQVFNRADMFRVSYTLRNKDTREVIASGSTFQNINGNFYEMAYNERRKYFVKDFIIRFDGELRDAAKKTAFSILNDLNL